MKKMMVIGLILISSIRSFADEGMWLPMLLGKQVYADMVKRGLKVSKEQLYSINKTSLKDAVIIFSGFCTGEIVSNEGLIFTNHHCGYEAIAAASTCLFVGGALRFVPSAGFADDIPSAARCCCKTGSPGRTNQRDRFNVLRLTRGSSA